MNTISRDQIYALLPEQINEPWQLMNVIRNSLGADFQAVVREANADNSVQVGKDINSMQLHKNNWLGQLVDRIGLVIIRGVLLENPFKLFKKGEMPLGYNIEKIFVDIFEAKQYDPDGSEQTLLKQEKPNVKAFYHERNREEFFKTTVRDVDLRSAFVSWADFDNFFSRTISAVYNSAEVREYLLMKKVIDDCYAEGFFKVVEIPEPKDEQSTKNAIKKMRATAKKMTLPQGSKMWNHAGVWTRTLPKDCFIIIDADFEAEHSVDVLASAFNMSNADFIGRKIVIEGFSTTGLKAVMIDQNWYMVYDHLHQMESFRNTEGLYTNYTYHVWQTISASTLENAVAFVVEGSPKPEEKEVVVSPQTADVEKGKTQQFSAEVKVKEATK